MGPTDDEGDGGHALHGVAVDHKQREKRQCCRTPGLGAQTKGPSPPPLSCETLFSIFQQRLFQSMEGQA